MSGRTSLLVTLIGIGALCVSVLASPFVVQQSMVSGAVVVHGTDEPAADARITLIDPSGRRLLRTATADADGVFRFPGVEPGRYLLSATKSSFIATEYGANRPERIGTPIVVSGGLPVSNLRLTLFRSGVISGTVLGPDGRPIARAGVTAYRRRHQPGGGVVPAAQGQATTDDRGVYRIFGLPPGVYIVATVATGRGSGSSDLPAVLVSTYFPASTQLANAASVDIDSGDEKSGIDIRLNAATTTSFKVTVRGIPKRADGSLLSVRLSLTSRDDLAAGAGLRTATVVDGGYLFRYLPLGRYRLSASIASAVGDGPDADFVAESDVDVLSVDPPPLDVALQPGSAVTGVVQFASPRGPGDISPTVVRIQLRTVETGTLRAQSPVANNGIFTMRGVPAGRYRLDVRPVPGVRSILAWRTAAVAIDDRVMDSSVIDLAAGRPNRVVVTLTDDTATLSGSLSAGLAPNATAPFVVLVPLTSQRYESGTILVVRPASDRSFELAGIRAGDYAVAVVDDFDPDAANDTEAIARLKASAIVTLSFGAGERRRADLRER